MCSERSGGPVSSGDADRRRQSWIESRQEEAYRDAADQLGLGGDPVAAWQTLSHVPGWSDAPGSAALRGRPGWDQFGPEDWEAFDRQLAATRARDADPLPRPFEHRAHYHALE